VTVFACRSRRAFPITGRQVGRVEQSPVFGFLTAIGVEILIGVLKETGCSRSSPPPPLPSLGSVGDAYDNALCESFFATLECELLERRRFTSKIEAKMAASASSKVGTTRSGCTQPSATARQWPIVTWRVEGGNTHRRHGPDRRRRTLGRGSRRSSQSRDPGSTQRDPRSVRGICVTSRACAEHPRITPVPTLAWCASGGTPL
jgi:hypothetical protein